MNKLLLPKANGGYLLILITTYLLSVSAWSYNQESEPSLLITSADVKSMIGAASQNSIFGAQYQAVKADVDQKMQMPLAVPVPKDAGGGYTHEQHKLNYKLIHDAGLIYQISKEARYANFAKQLLNAYADLYPTLGEHPEKKEQSPGRLFWQSLNEAVWLVYTIQGYDAIAASLTAKEKAHIENSLLLPVADFLSEQSPKTFNKIHNHGTWAAAAVGMTGYSLGRPKLVEQALLGLDRSGKSGFLKQLDRLFSPDGYYNEGPYYQRYALMPFILFAKAIETNQPEKKIFEYRDGIIKKAVYTALQLSYNNYFFPINDALKDKGIDTQELVYGVNIIYAQTRDPQLLSIANLQQQVLLSGDGVAVSEGLLDNQARPFDFSTQLLADGPFGKQGALAVIRSGPKQKDQALVVKNTSQGMNHGHFDKLHWLFYDNGEEIVTDYGAARYLNIEAKYGGHYLPENRTWAKQTIAHNTVVVDELSHFDGILKTAEQHSPEQLVFTESEAITFSAASMKSVNQGVDLLRSMAMIHPEGFEHPIILDLLKVSSEKSHQYDLPLHFQGQIIDVNFPIETSLNSLKPLGDKNGYQHLWKKSEGQPGTGIAQLTWILKDRFYTYSQITEDASKIFFVELGANDPNFNLRREQAVISRVQDKKSQTFVSVLEPHGQYNPRLEFTKDSYSQVASIELVTQGDYDIVKIRSKRGKTWRLLLSYDNDENKEHRLNVAGDEKKWKGFFHWYEA